MLLIGLVGGSDADRLSVACDVIEQSQKKLSLHNAATKTARLPRVRELNVVLSGATGAFSLDRGLVFSSVQYAEEALQIRAAGGVIWHVQGLPSGEIPILRNDLLVTVKVGGDRHFRDAAEALGETVIRARKRQLL